MKRIIIYIIMLVAIAACTNEEGPDILAPVPPEDTELLIRINFPGDDNGFTKSLSEDEEKKIDNLRVFVFTSGGTDNQLEDKFAYEIDTLSLSDVSGNNQTITITARKMGQKQRFVLVANLPGGLILTPSEGSTMGDIFTSLAFSASPWRTLSTNGYPAFPMWGQMKDFVLISTKESPSNPIEVNMFRAMARINVGVDMDNLFPQLITDFKIEEVYVCNTADFGYLTPHDNYMKGAGIDETIINEPKPYTSKYPEQTYSVPDKRQLLNTIYIPESDISSPTFIVIRATWKGKTNCFYRIDFAQNGNLVPVLRNHAYKINITKVNTTGYSSLDEAKDAPPSGLDNNLIVDGMNSNINEIAYNNDDMLGVSVSEVLFDWDESLIGKALASTDKNEYDMKLYTTYPQWSATLEDGVSWITLVDDGTEKNTIENKKQPVNQQSVFGIRIKEENRSGKERDAKINIKAGMLSLSINVRQSGGANCYLIRFKETENTAKIRIPLSFASAAMLMVGSDLDGIDINMLKARVLWREVTNRAPVMFTAEIGGSGNPSEHYIEVTATSSGSYYGNAVIALVSGNDIGMVGGTVTAQVQWSCHIWSMPENKDVDKDYHEPNTDKFMSCVLGKNSENKGLFYQWGRKDPFPQNTTNVSPRTVLIEPVTASNTASFVMKNPTVFYNQSGSFSDWLATGVTPNRWTENSKSTYNDPCPTGWRVAADNEKYDWPVPGSTTADLLNGMLKGTDGQWDNSGGYVWLSSHDGEAGYPFWQVDGSNVVQSTISLSTEGRSVRCVKDVKLVKSL